MALSFAEFVGRLMSAAERDAKYADDPRQIEFKQRLEALNQQREKELGAEGAAR